MSWVKYIVTLIEMVLKFHILYVWIEIHAFARGRGKTIDFVFLMGVTVKSYAVRTPSGWPDQPYQKRAVVLVIRMSC